MKSSKNYIEVNKESWNNRTEIHVRSDFYDNENFYNANVLALGAVIGNLCKGRLYEGLYFLIIV